MSGYCLLPSFKTVVSLTSTTCVGSGVTKRKHETTVYFFAERHGNGEVTITPLSPKWLPLESECRSVGDEFYEEYRPEPLIFLNKVMPAMQAVQDALDKADRLREAGQDTVAEREYGVALRLSPGNIRATFGLGLVYLHAGHKGGALRVFRQLLDFEAAFSGCYKHLFNEFGMALRRSGLHREALKFYTKAIGLGHHDDHLLFNVARVLFDLGELRRSLDLLHRALALNPAFNEAQAMLSVVERKLETIPTA